MWTVGTLIVLSLCLGIAAWLFFMSTVKSGQYDDVEGIKYRMLEDDDEDDEGTGWPTREQRGGDRS